MLAWVLDQAGLKPGFLIGGVPSGFEVSARLGESDLFVIEADEYDTAFFDKRSKFVHYRPTVAVLNNLEYDHADIFPDLAAIETQFHHLVRTVPGNGLVVCPSQTESIERVLKRGCWTPITRFGADDASADWSARIQGATRFEVVVGGQKPGDFINEVSWDMSGLHSINNALAVIAAAQNVGVAPAVSCKALNSFPGVKRRMELRGEVRGVRVYDDFAHHPTAIATTLAGARDVLLDLAAKNGQKPGRLIAVFEPRSNTMKMGTMKAALPESLQGADCVWTYSGGVDWDVADAMAPLGAKCRTERDLSVMVDLIAKQAEPGDWIVVMSNGAFGGVHGKLLDKLSQ
jgi:UDP-N-acetylmuramate: L-alanyl-gamma-D-glutamyl-meso-diaminopimelate ligase